MMYMKHETKGLVTPNIMKKIIRQESTKQMQKHKDRVLKYTRN
jgi:hypothetical protein